MAGTIAPAFGRPFVDNAGKPLSGGKLLSFLAGTTTPTPIYTDVGLTVPHPNPLTLDSSGRPPITPSIFLAPTSYKFELRTSADALIWIVDNISAVPPNEVDLDLQGVAGEALADRDVVFLSNGTGGTTAGRWYKADADIVDRSTGANILGIVPSALDAGATGAIRLQGRVTGFSGLTPGAAYYISAVAGQLTSVAPPNARFIGIADTTTTLVMTVSGVAQALPASPVFTSVQISSTAPSALDVGGGIVAGTGNVQVVDATGKIPAIDSTRFASLSGANLTGIPETAISDGAILARVNGAETITAVWDFDAPMFFSAPSDRNIVIVTNTGNGIAMRIRGRIDNNLGDIQFTDNTETTLYGSIGITPGAGLTYFAVVNGHKFAGGPVVVDGNATIGGTLGAAGAATFGSVAVTGASLLSGLVQVGAAIRSTGVISPAALSTNQNNYNPPGLAAASVLRLASTFSINISGIAAQPDGQEITILNINPRGGAFIQFLHEDAGSVAANRFALPDALNAISLQPLWALAFRYDGPLARWVVKSR